MGQHVYRAWNGPMPTTGIQAAVSTGTAIKTMLQIATPATRQIKLVEWGYSLNIATSIGPSVIELLETDVAATVTAHVAAGVQPVFPGVPASLVTLGAAATGYTSSAEGAITATRIFDSIDSPPSDSASPSILYQKIFMPGKEPVIGISKFLRIRCLMGSAVNMRAYIVWEE